MTGEHPRGPITLRRLKWLAVLAPLLYLGALELLRRAYHRYRIGQAISIRSGSP